MWAATRRWNIFAAYFVALWFHEFLVGGRDEPDNLISNWMGVNLFTWVVSLSLTGYTVYVDYNNSV
jgi:hypothetical protein